MSSLTWGPKNYFWDVSLAIIRLLFIMHTRSSLHVKTSKLEQNCVEEKNIWFSKCILDFQENHSIWKQKIIFIRVESLISNITEHIIYYNIPYITHNFFNKMFENSVSRIKLWIDFCTRFKSFFLLGLAQLTTKPWLLV